MLPARSGKHFFCGNCVSKQAYPPPKESGTNTDEKNEKKLYFFTSLLPQTQTCTTTKFTKFFHAKGHHTNCKKPKKNSYSFISSSTYKKQTLHESIYLRMQAIRSQYFKRTNQFFKFVQVEYLFN